MANSCSIIEILAFSGEIASIRDPLAEGPARLDLRAVASASQDTCPLSGKMQRAHCNSSNRRGSHTKPSHPMPDSTSWRLGAAALRGITQAMQVDCGVARALIIWFR